MMKGGGGRKPSIQRKDRDEDLLLFRELHKREKDRIASLLQPVSDEFEPNAATGNYALYKIASGKKGSSGYDLFGEKEKEKNDYDWLKTPPATPLFPSLEMEATGPELVVHRELPIVQPLSRFSGNSGAPKGRPKSPKPKPKVPQRSITPSQRQSTHIISSSETKNTKPVINHKTNINTSRITITQKESQTRQTRIDSFLTSNLSKTLQQGTTDTLTATKTKPRSRGVSPSMRSTIPAQIPGFSNEPPPNLRTTERSTSATRGRPNSTTISSYPQNNSEPPPNLRTAERSTSATRGRPNSTTTISSYPQNNSEPLAGRPRRQSCSPSVARGRKVVEAKQVEEGEGKRINNNVVGSRIVEKVMNARKSGGDHHQERETKIKSRGSISQVSAFGSMMSKSSLDMALKHMDTKRDRMNNSRLLGIIPAKSSTRE